MDAGMEVLEGIIIFIVVGGSLISIAPPIILDIIWYKRVKNLVHIIKGIGPIYTINRSNEI